MDSNILALRVWGHF